MPTLEHNGLVDMFRENPPLAPHFLEILFHVDVPRYASVGVVESALDQLVPVEFRADLVLELRDEAGHVVLSIILEVQRDGAPDLGHLRESGVDPRQVVAWLAASVGLLEPSVDAASPHELITAAGTLLATPAC